MIYSTKSRRRRSIIGLLCACFILLALGYTSAMWADYYFAPELVGAWKGVSSGEGQVEEVQESGSVLLVCRENPALISASALHIYRSGDGVLWKRLARLPVSAGPAVVKDGELFVFHRGDFPAISLSVIESGEGFETAWKHSGRYEFTWSPIIALVEGGRIRLYGYEENERGGRLREAVVEGDVAHDTGFSYPLGSLAEISGCVHREDTYLFFRETGSEQTQCIIVARPDRVIKRFSGIYAFSAVSDGKSVYLFGSPREREDKQSERLIYYKLRGVEVSGAYEWGHNLRNIWGGKRRIVESSAAFVGSRIFVCIRGGDEIGVARFADGQGNFIRVVRMPLSGRIAVWIWVGSILSVCAALIVFAFLLARSKGGRMKVAGSSADQTAPIHRRFLAFAIDLCIMLVLFLVSSTPLAREDNHSILQLLQIDHPLLLRFLSLAYFALPEAIFRQTPGKRLMGIVVCTEEGKRVSLWSAVLRNLFKLIYFLLLVEAVVVLYTRRAQRLGDITAGTVVLAKKQQK